MRGKLMLDDNTHLTPTQSKLLLFLLEKEEPVPSEEVYREVWQTDWTGGVNTLHTTICHLRQKVKPYFSITSTRIDCGRVAYGIEVNGK